MWVTNGQVRAIAVSNDLIYLGGDFTELGPAIGAAVAIDATTGAPIPPYPLVIGLVGAVAPDGNGGWYIGGSFSTVLGQPRNNIAQLDASGNLTA